jgi:hypothetical protein
LLKENKLGCFDNEGSIKMHVNNINHIERVEFSPITREDTSKAISLFNKLINGKNNKKKEI